MFCRSRRRQNVPDTSAAPSSTTVSAPAEAPQEKPKRVSWWRRWSRRRTPVNDGEVMNRPSSATERSINTIKESEDGEPGVQEAPSTPDTPVAAPPELQPEATEVAEDRMEESEGGEAGVQEAPSTLDPPVSAAPELQPQDLVVAEDRMEESEGGEAGVQKAPSTLDPPVSAAPELQPVVKDVAEDAMEESECGEAGVQEAPSTPDTPVSAETGKKKKKPRWLRWLLSLRKKQKSKSPAETDGAEKSSPSETAETDTGVISAVLPTDAPKPRLSTPTGHGGSTQGRLLTSARKETLSRKELVCLGLPNLAQTCYMNSTLQGLLTLFHFVQEVRNQHETLSSRPESRLMRGFVEVGDCRSSKKRAKKKRVLAAFKKTVAEFNSEFEDNSQKDAHEFLSCVLDELRTQSVNMGIGYTCPVSNHIAFQMLSTRTCGGCGVQSARQEDYLNLSLDLVPGGSVSQCLEEYLKESQLEYRCECGAEDSSQQCSFLTLPKVLILQLKRFRFTPSFNLEKVDSPVLLSRELAVNLGSAVAAKTSTRYSLVSIVSHLGSTAQSGHYICEGAYRDQDRGDVTDQWLTYNDENVSETTFASVSHKRRQTAYLLLYERQQ